MARTPCINLYSIGRLPWYKEGSRLEFFYTPRLGLPSIAAVTPSDWEVAVYDGISSREIDYEAPADLVGFSVLTPFATESYAAAESFRRRSIPVVLGGAHPTLMPDEAKSHADAVVIGEGELVWPKLLSDFRAGKLRPFYRQNGRAPIESLPMPRFSAIRNHGTLKSVHAMQLVRGCPHGRSCRFCVVPRIFGSRRRAMPIATAIEQLDLAMNLEQPCGVNLSACCPMNDREYISSFAQAAAPLRIQWHGAALLDRLDDDRLIETLRRGGCVLIYTESGVVSERKNRRKHKAYCSALQKIRAHGIAVSYNFTVGFDDDDPTMFEDISSFIEETGLRRELCAIQIFAPWPNTPAFKRLDRAGRITDRDWAHYDNTRAVFAPRQMTMAEFDRAIQRGVRLIR